ncbi:hypothetical protein [Niabella beijingensis]|uniref:hypothetical protein n=1 Tax=Niabella beijingensis TaxID=2872700 RepID=UPI001CBC0DF2|nr:hypothetical protein [Niabella beijingensis]MBZ4189642.1 hypothetical protein [Niabella beijingensis]
MNKKIILPVLLLLTFSTAAAQSRDTHKSMQGRYGGTSDGICLFADSTFLLYGYATMVFGKYALEKELLSFYPDRPEQVFSVYARSDQSIKGIRMAFGGFEEGATFIRFDDHPVQRVFNEHANCFAAPFVWDTTYRPGQIGLSHRMDAPWRGEQSEKEPGSYRIPVKENDYILVYNKPDRHHDPFKGRITTKEGITLLQTTLTSRSFEKQEEADNNWQEIMQQKAAYDPTDRNDAIIYVNNHYRPSEEIDTAAYIYDTASNQYISRQVFDKEQNYRLYENNDYNSDDVLRKYTRVRLIPVEQKDPLPGKTDTRSLFYTTCEEPEKSYRYKGIKEIPDENKQLPVPTTAAPVIE